MEDLEVLVTGDELTLKGERREVKLEGASYHRHERGVGTFSRTVRLPIAIDSNKVQARLQEGVLTVTLPKSEASRPRKIEVKSVE
jgi:HSP20 family protein